MPCGLPTALHDVDRLARPAPTHANWVYRLARRLEAYSFAAAPEQFAVVDGLRAAVAVASLLGLAVLLDRPALSWAAFGAFWTCLADPGGPTRRRLAYMGGFAVAGAVAAFASSAAGETGMAPAAAMLLVLVFITGLSGAYGPAAAQVGTLAAVVAVVAVAFPQPLRGAMTLSGAFLLGAGWALVLCIGIWRIHPHAATRRALSAVYLRLGDMLGDLLAPDALGAAAAAWSRVNAEHRRAVRNAIERARGGIVDLDSGAARYLGELDTADRIFASLLATSHDRDTRGTTTAVERGLLHRLLRLLAEARRQTTRRTPQPGLLANQAAGLVRATGAISTVTGRAVAVAARALGDQVEAWRGRVPAAAAPEDAQATAGLVRPSPAAILRHAARIGVAVVIAYALAAALGLRFSYWATVATVVVLQPFAPAIWPRSLERMLGSIVGGLLAALLLLALPTGLGLLPAIFPVATATIALRRVNYTLFVLCLTSLFVLVAELLQPASGIAAARAIDNVIGSVVGAAAGLLLWPERGADSPASLLAAAVSANVALAAQAVAGGDAAGFDAARRVAGVASTVAETTCRRLALAGQSRRLHLREATPLLAALRGLAGAATAQVLADGQPDPARAAALEHETALFVAAVGDPAGMTRLPTPYVTPRDDIDAALGRVTHAAAAYVGAVRAAAHSPD